MTIIEMLQQSAVLTIVGMAVVFIFLWFMTVCISFIGKFFKGVDEPEKNMAQGLKNLPLETVKPEIVAAITVAVNKYQNEEREQS